MLDAGLLGPNLVFSVGAFCGVISLMRTNILTMERKRPLEYALRYQMVRHVTCHSNDKRMARGELVQLLFSALF